MSVTETLQISVQSSSGLTSMSGYDNEFGATEINGPLVAFAANSNSSPFTLALTAANTQLVFLCATQNCTITTNGTNTADVQTITITGTPTGGWFPVGFNGAVTSAAYNTNSSTMQTQLRAMSSINGANVTCSGGPLPGTPITCTFAGSLAPGKQPIMVVDSSQLTGGTNSTVSVAHTTPGQPSDTISLVANIPRIWGASSGYGSNPFTTDVTNAHMTCTAATLLNFRIVET
jgi:hypothetical protein